MMSDELNIRLKIFYLKEGAAPGEGSGVRRTMFRHLTKHWRLETSTMSKLEQNICRIGASR